MPAEGGQGGTMGKLEGNPGVMTCWNAYIRAWSLNGIFRKCNMG